MKKKHLLLSVFVFLGMQGVFSQTRIAFIKGFDSVPYAFVAGKNEGEENFVFLEYEDIKRASEDVVNRKADALILSVNGAASLYNHTKGRIVCAAVLQETDFYCVTTNQSVKNLSDLLEKRVTCVNGGIQKSYISWILKGNDLPVGKGNGGILVLWDKTPSLSLSHFLSSDVPFGIFCEPELSLALKNSKSSRIAIDFQDEYEALKGSSGKFPKTVLVLNRSYTEEQASDMADFLSTLMESVDKIIQNPALASSECKKNNLCTDALILSESIGRSSICFKPASECASEISEIIRIVNETESSSIKLDDDFVLKY